VARAADDWLFENEPRHSSMLRTSVSPNIFQGGYRSNVIPSEAKATLDVRMVPDENRDAFLEEVKKIVNDPAIEVRFSGNTAAERPIPPVAKLDSEIFRTGRSQRDQDLQHSNAAVDVDRRHRHAAAARERRAVRRHRSGDRRRGPGQRLRHAQRPGAAARKRAPSLSCDSTGTS
jgi:acetylornithine deacetylase/succinyl-diaminopimelate desuccinylase-like protein